MKNLDESNDILEGNDTLESNEHWISVSDLMSGLMMIFLLISISYMIKVDIDKDKIKEVAVIYTQTRDQLFEDLRTEFEQDLTRWGAEIEKKDLSIKFYQPEVLFDTGHWELKNKFKQILSNFIPRYLHIITSKKYKSNIAEVRIEGHTSSFWNNGTPEMQAYFNNMNLSQARTRSTLEFIMTLKEAQKEKNWLKKKLTANGLSSSHLKYYLNGKNKGKENYLKSQRVEFKIRTDAESKIAKILELN